MPTKPTLKKLFFDEKNKEAKEDVDFLLNHQDFIENEKGKIFDNRDFRHKIAKFLYEKKEFNIIKNRIIRKGDVLNLNYKTRTLKFNNNYFNKVSHETILYFIEENNIEKEELKIILGLSNNDLRNIYRKDRFEKTPLNFKFVYDLCFVLNIGMDEIVEKMEKEFLK